jgi:predicted aminopeptidase|tara:strand:- start:6785 stop:7891 length:1107 start_codon:yes stop_codon:yes gene_type:complete
MTPVLERCLQIWPVSQVRGRWLLGGAVLLAMLMLAGCESVRYYGQAALGQSSLLWHSRPLAVMMDDPDVPALTRERLALVDNIRRFAGESLLLPADHSYRRYTKIDRDFVLWNVFAAPEFSIEPKVFCFPVIGCLGYRGYFARKNALVFAEKLRAKGFETYVGPVAAYSTLGWFADPVLSSVLAFADTDLAGLIFHELAHEHLYIEDDTTFNESFATFVEREGTRRWLLASGREADIPAYLEARGRLDAVIGLVLDFRRRLDALYGKKMPIEQMRAHKAVLLEELQVAYQELVRQDLAGGWDAWFDQPLNNAQLATIGAYFKWVPAFAQLFEQTGRDLKGFYQAAERVGTLPAADRHALMAKKISSSE